MSAEAACSDDSFGPWAGATCRGGFDFTLLFEETILSILPSVLVIVVAPIPIIRLAREPPKVRASALDWFKKVWRHPLHLDVCCLGWAKRSLPTRRLTSCDLPNRSRRYVLLHSALLWSAFGRATPPSRRRARQPPAPSSHSCCRLFTSCCQPSSIAYRCARHRSLASTWAYPSYSTSPGREPFSCSKMPLTAPYHRSSPRAWRYESSCYCSSPLKSAHFCSPSTTTLHRKVLEARTI